MLDRSCAVSKLPLEMFLEIFSYLSDHRHFIRVNFNGRARSEFGFVGKEHAEQSIVIRRLTMTCWQLRDMLIPLLWTDVEACVRHTHYDPNTGSGGVGSSLYAICLYLSLNRTIAVHVRFVRLFTPWFTAAQDHRSCRTLSVILWFQEAPQDLMKKFVNCLVQLPNLNTLEILDVGSWVPISTHLSRRKVIFPSIRVLRITSTCHPFIKKCPNLEDLTFTNMLNSHAQNTLRYNGETLKRVAGVGLSDVGGEFANKLPKRNNHLEETYRSGSFVPKPSRDRNSEQDFSERSNKRSRDNA